jgi:hypothetical protein
MRWFHSGRVAATVALLALAGCGGGNPVVGKWADDSNATVEFVSGGTCLVVANRPAAINCTWEMAGDGRVVMHESYMSMNVTFIGHIDGNELLLLGPDGKPMPPLHKIN